MAEGDPVDNKGTTPPGTDPKPTDAGVNEGVDTSKFTQADWDKIYADPKLYEHTRFKNLNDQAKQAKILSDEKKAAEEKRLTDEKNFQELAKRKEDEAKSWQTKAEAATIDNRIAWEAQKLGVVDIEAATKLIDRNGIKLGEDGSVTGVAEAVKALVDSKPYLKGGSPQKPNIGGGTNPNNPNNTVPRFKLSQIQDHEFFMKHEKEIQQAYIAGNIENDMGQTVTTQ